MAARLESGGINFAVEDLTGGEGPTVVFVHGLGGSINSWLAQLEACRERGWRAIAYDQRGAGRSDHPPGPYSVDLWVDDLCRLLDTLGLERTALVGHSVGCMVTERAAVRLGERIWALAVCGGALAWRPESAPVFAERVELARAGRMDEIAETVAGTGLSERCRREDPRLLGLMREIIASNDPRAYADCSAATATATMADPAELACPVLALCGAEDPVAPLPACEAIASAAAKGQTAEVAGCAHWCMLEDPGATNAVLFEFLETQAQRAL
jgi:3-oxoadipate enol-lactonase